MNDINEVMVERMRSLWGGYKFYIIAAVLMMVSAAAGLSYQSAVHYAEKREAGGALFALLRAAEDGDTEAAERELSRIRGEKFTPLRNLALAAVASARHKAGNTAEAADALREAETAETDTGLRLMLVLRLAELLINEEKYGEALEYLNAQETAEPLMKILFAERRGDAHFAAGQFRAAHWEYTGARAEAEKSFRGYMPLLNLKIGAAVSLPSGAQIATDETSENANVAGESMANDNSANENSAGESMANENAANGNSADESMANDNAANENSAGESMANEDSANGNSAGESMANENAANENSAGESIANDNSASDSASDSVSDDSSVE